MKRKIAFNTLFILFFAIFIGFSHFMFSFFINSKDGNIFPAIISSMPTIFFLFTVIKSPVVYVFDEDKLTIIYCLGIKEVILWQDIQSITRRVRWVSHEKAYERGLPVYLVNYTRKKEKPFFFWNHIANTAKTTDLLKKYYKKNIKEDWKRPS